MEVVS